LTDFDTPTFFFGKLIEVTEQQIFYLRYALGLEMTFRGGRYVFEVLELTGLFKFVRRD
jgi:hypothetical protein